MEKLELFQRGKLRGAELLEVMHHLEDCDHCFGNLPPQDPKELLNRIFKPEDEETETEDSVIDEDKYEN